MRVPPAGFRGLKSELKWGLYLGPHWQYLPMRTGLCSPLTQETAGSQTCLRRPDQNSLGWLLRKAPPQHSRSCLRADSRKKHVSGKARLLETGKAGLGKHLAFFKC